MLRNSTIDRRGVGFNDEEAVDGAPSTYFPRCVEVTLNLVATFEPRCVGSDGRLRALPFNDDKRIGCDQVRDSQLRRRKEGAEAATINRETSALSRMVHLAIRRGLLEREGFFEHDECLRVRAVVPNLQL